MRPLPLIFLVLVSIVALAIVGCCGSPAATAPQGAVLATPSAMSSTVTHDGCSIRGGIECGGKALGAIDLELPSPAGIVGAIRDWVGIAGGGTLPFAAETQAAECAPTGRWVTETRQVWVGD